MDIIFINSYFPLKMFTILWSLRVESELNFTVRLSRMNLIVPKSEVLQNERFHWWNIILESSTPKCHHQHLVESGHTVTGSTWRMNTMDKKLILKQ